MLKKDRRYEYFADFDSSWIDDEWNLGEAQIELIDNINN